MACRSDYLEPTTRELELKRTARLLIYVLETLGEPVSPQLEKDAAALYGGADYVPELCAKLRTLPPDKLNEIVYDAHNRSARDLANWWEEHQAADRRREADERAAQYWDQHAPDLIRDFTNTLRPFVENGIKASSLSGVFNAVLSEVLQRSAPHK